MTGFRVPRNPLDALRPAAFGADPSGERMARILRSPHFAGGVFVNPPGPERTPSTRSMLGYLPTYFRKEERVRRAPAHPIPVHPTTVADLAEPAESGLRLTWMGHSAVLTEIDGHRVLIDPVWSERCSPFAFAGPRRLHPVPIPLAETGRVDAVVISHDHYDHLDMPTVRALARTGTEFVVPLGVGAHLEHWGIPAGQITELDWHETTFVGELTLTATPARHFCGRALRNTQHTLWASWVIAGPRHRVFHSGDTGYFPGFAGIGERYGPFDATMIQIGAYSEFWPDIHMEPEEGLRAHLDLQGSAPAERGVLLPIHWGTFNLAPHPWDEPAERTVTAARRAGVRYAVPRPGQPFEPAAGLRPDPWWQAVAAEAPQVRGAGRAPAPAARLDLAAER
ncbi:MULTISPECIES: MBL fold metallo-hydrolase [Streptomyces]|uniref:MBL fold metallo-hydrolase n=1 Tax=Streptomyces TaxID=1883 RepID=UPI00163BFFA3|nr:MULTISPECIES: MBL fold metallo-hydrolase [Streptomyces]MBC2875621.1 MBL fold metallo-hydrolase [Streptomyces sp. TYQ1024]UBI35852.1 MBL fold metallo-hydrolase [Streptomyces mobaraensis]UKW28446.1 MBL fold metallo-hydrolase [Streptomyces sp. TYQ1024]